MVSLTFSVLLAMFDVLEFEEWTIENFILFRSYQITHGLLVWSAENYGNSTAAIEEKYASNITAGTIILGVTGTLMTLSGIFQDFVIQDLMMFASLAILSTTSNVIASLQLPGESSNIYPTNIQQQWKNCENLKTLSDSGNKAFGLTLKILHIKCLFTFSFILLGWLNNDRVQLFNSVVALNALKLIFFYWVAGRTSENVSHASVLSQQILQDIMYLFICSTLYIP